MKTLNQIKTELKEKYQDESEDLINNVVEVISSYYTRKFTPSKCITLLESRRFQVNRGGVEWNKYWQFRIKDNDVYHRVVVGHKWPTMNMETSKKPWEKN